MKKNERANSVSSYISFLLKFLLLFIKAFIFYKSLRLGGLLFAFAAATCAIYILVYFIIQFFSRKHAGRVATVIYFIISAVMAVDAVYFAYVSHMPSVTQLAFAAQLTNVKSTVRSLIKPEHILLIADLPLFLIYFINRSTVKNMVLSSACLHKIANVFRTSIPNKIASIVTAAIFICCAIIAPLTPQFELNYLSNELFCYHISDIVGTIAGGNIEYEVNKAAYISPDYSSSDYYGIADGRNLIVIQVEALQNFVIGQFYNGQEITPNMNRLISNDSFYFDNYYYQIGGGNTADAEFTVNNSLFAPENDAAYIKYNENTYYGLPYLLKDNGYSGAHAFHNYIGSFWNRDKAYPVQGFDSFTALEDLEETDMFALGLSDRELFRQTSEMLITYEEPFYAFYVTVSSHHPYGIPIKDRAIALSPEDEGTLYGLYLQAINYADRAIGEFMDMLKEAGLYENSVIVIYGDHYALTNSDVQISNQVSSLKGSAYSIFDVFNVPLIINIPGMGMAETVHTAGGHIDLMPTLLCLLGIQNDKSVMFGQNLMDAEEGLVCEQAHVSIGSFISDEVFFQKPHNGIKENYSVYEKATMQMLDPDLYKEQSELAEQRILDCAALMERNDLLLD